MAHTPGQYFSLSCTKLRVFCKLITHKLLLGKSSPSQSGQQQPHTPSAAYTQAVAEEETMFSPALLVSSNGSGGSRTTPSGYTSPTAATPPPMMHSPSPTEVR
jgi:hypothetical protein